jgi:hypothetical protein
MGGHVWGDQHGGAGYQHGGAGWVDPGRLGAWGDAAGGACGGWAQGGRGAAGGGPRAWGGLSGLGGAVGQSATFGGKASYNSVGPPPSIAYEHRMVMAEEAGSANPYAMPTPPSGVSGTRQDTSDVESRHGRRDGDYIQGDARDGDEGRERRRSFREEAGDREPGRVRRSFREAPVSEAVQPGPGGNEEAPAADLVPRKRRFVELFPEEAGPLLGGAADEAQVDEAMAGRSSKAQADARASAARGEELAVDGTHAVYGARRACSPRADGSDAPRVYKWKTPPAPFLSVLMETSSFLS